MTFKNWDGQDLKGKWLFTYKIDGVQATVFREDDQTATLVSKGGHFLHNIPFLKKPKFEKAEVFCGTWNNTMSIVRASKSQRRLVHVDEIYPLYPKIDPRLVIGTFINPTAEFINIAINQALSLEYEGLVLRQGDTFIKVKSSYTVDVKITGFVEGKGKHKGSLGKILTECGGVGAGFNDKQRQRIWNLRKYLLGKVVEVKAMEMTSNGKFRHGRFIRLRLDKA